MEEDLEVHPGLTLRLQLEVVRGEDAADPVVLKVSTVAVVGLECLPEKEPLLLVVVWMVSFDPYFLTGVNFYLQKYTLSQKAHALSYFQNYENAQSTLLMDTLVKWTTRHLSMMDTSLWRFQRCPLRDSWLCVVCNGCCSVNILAVAETVVPRKKRAK